jgi:hypothetical protein
MKSYITILMLLAIMVSGCSSMTSPSLLNTANDPNTMEQKPISDKVIFQFSDDLKNWWGTRSVKAEIFGTGLLIALDGVTSAALATSGAGAGTVRGLVGAIDFLKSVYQRINPQARDNAFNTGSGIVLVAQGEYMTCITQKRSAVPSDKTVSPCGAKFLAKINSAVAVVGSLMVGILPSKEDFDTVTKSFTALAE